MLKRGLARVTTLRWRLTLFYCGLLALLLLGLGVFVYTRLESSLMDTVRGRLLDHARLFKLEFAATTAPSMIIVPNPKVDPSTLKPGQSLAAPVPDPAGPVQIGSALQQEPGASDLYLALLDGKGLPLASNQPVVRFNETTSITPTFPLAGLEQQPPTLPNGPYFYETSLQRRNGNGNEISQERGLAYIEPLRQIALEKSATTGSAFSGYIMLAMPLGDVDRTLNSFRAVLLTGVLAELLIAGLLGLPLARLGLRPLQRITATATRIGNGDLSQRVALPAQGRLPPAADDEVQQLALAFNGMLDKIQAAFAAQQRSEARSKQFAADASHELRSPLTVLGGYLDVLLMGVKDDPAQTERILHAMQRENDRLGRLVVDLLFLTRIDANGAASLRLAPLPIADLITRVVANMTLLTGGRTLQTAIAPAAAAVCVQGDGDGLYQVLANLLDNSIRYTHAAGRITVSLDVERATLADDPREWAVIGVADDGCGIAAGELPRIFDRFYRADRSRARQTGNAGLGLAIAKSIVEAHGGTIVATSTPGQGTRFTIRLPLLVRPAPPAEVGPASENAQQTLSLFSGPPKPGVLH